MAQNIKLNGYFTLLKYLFDKSGGDLESSLGFSPNSLSAGWMLLIPVEAVKPENIDLKGSTRWSDGVMPNGKNISDVLAGRTDVVGARSKLTEFFHKSPENSPAKVLPANQPTHYPSAKPVGVPQFRIKEAIAWKVAVVVPPGGTLAKRYFV